MSDKFLELKLDQYAGNVDEIVYTALTGNGSDRHGEKEAKVVFKQNMAPLLKHDAEYDYYDLPVELYNFESEYGLTPYSLGSTSDRLRVCIDFSTEESLKELFDIWTKAYGVNGVITITVPFSANNVVTVKVLEIDLIERIEKRSMVYAA